MISQKKKVGIRDGLDYPVYERDYDSKDGNHIQGQAHSHLGKIS